MKKVLLINIFINVIMIVTFYIYVRDLVQILDVRNVSIGYFKISYEMYSDVTYHFQHYLLIVPIISLIYNIAVFIKRKVWCY